VKTHRLDSDKYKKIVNKTFLFPTLCGRYISPHNLRADVENATCKTCEKIDSKNREFITR